MIPIQAKLAIAGITMVGVFAFGFQVASWKHGKVMALHLAADADAESAMRLHAEKLAKASLNAASEKAELEAKLAAERTKKQRVITREVVKYVQAPDTGKCNIDDAFVRIHNNAARPVLPSDTPAASR